MADTEVQVKKEAPKPAVKKQELPLRTKFYSFIKALAVFVTHTIFPVTYHNRETLLAQKGPFVLIANHHCWADPVVIAAAVKQDQVTYLGKKDLVKNGFVDWFLRSLHMITVDRHNMDMAAMRSCSRVLREGGILGIFPEGTRYHEGVMEKVEEGTSLLTMRAHVPMLPAYISSKVRPFRRTHVYFGAPIEYEDLHAMGVNKETCKLLDERMVETYATMQHELRAFGE